MAGIVLDKGKVALVDRADVDWLSRLSNGWYAEQYHPNRTSEIWYAKARVGGRMVKMHNLILPPKSGFEVDHINRNGLDNRRSNLRYATRAENRQNGRKAKGKTSEFIGVSLWPYNGKWVAKIRVDRKLHHLGYFLTELEAAKAYDNAAKEHYGEHANTNF